jgi:hypothetical protein
MGPLGSGARRGGAVRPPGGRLVEAPDWGLVGISSCCIAISTSSLQSRLSYGPSEGADSAVTEPEGRAETEGLEGGGAAARVTPKAEGVRLPTELDAVEEDSVKLDEIVDGARGPRKR